MCRLRLIHQECKYIIVSVSQASIAGSNCDFQVLFRDVNSVMTYVEWKASGERPADYFSDLWPAFEQGDLELLCGVRTLFSLSGPWNG